MAKGNCYTIFLFFLVTCIPLEKQDSREKRVKVSTYGVLNKTKKKNLLSRKSPDKEPLYGYFVARFPSNRRFFTQNCRISRIVLRGNTTSKLSAINDDGNEKISKTKTLKE